MPAKCGAERLIVDDDAYMDSMSGVGVEMPQIAVDNEHLYYMLNLRSELSRTGHIMRVPLRGGTPEELLTLQGGGPRLTQGLAAFEGGLITARAPDDLSGRTGTGTILRISTDSSEPTVLAETTGAPLSLLVKGASVFFTDAEGTKEVSVDGGAVRRLTDAIPYSLSVAGSTLYLGTGDSLLAIDTDTRDVSVLVDEPALYPTACGDAVCWISGPTLSGELVRLGANGSRETLATGLSQVHALAFAEANLFWTMGVAPPSLLRVPVQGGTMTPVTSTPASNLALDDECVYWSGLSGIFSMSRARAKAARARTSEGFR